LLKNKFTYLLFIGFLILSEVAFSQNPLQKLGGRFQGGGGNRRAIGTGGNDSLTHRNDLEDSITISFRYLDSTQTYKLDSSVSDFTRRFPMPATNIYLGNLGMASKSLLFTPSFSAGFDPGFHAFDVYKWKLNKVRFFNTTRPYSELTYQLGTRVEQIIEILHTQNLKPNWNVQFQYRLINSPGFFKNQKTNHNNYLLNSWFQSKNKRYNNYFVFLNNKLQSSENGGMLDNENYLDNIKIYKDRFNIPTQLGGDGGFGTDFFSTKITTGNKYTESTILLRQQYDLGKKDSIVTDSTVVPLFYPRLRFEHTLQVNQKKYVFQDNVADSLYYDKYYDTTLRKPLDTFVIRESWKEIINDFSIYQYPDAKNLNQFIKLGLMIQNLTGELADQKKSFFNTAGHAEYRNKSRNKKWDIEANGKLFFTGLNTGDYQAHISIQGLAGKKIGYIQLGFENASRTPSFIYDSRSSFYFLKTAKDFKKENNTHLFASYFLPKFKFRLSGHYYLATNYTYVSKFYQLQQESSLFNVLQVAAEKTIKLGKRWNWHAEVYFQQVVGNAPVHVPTIYTRNRIAYEGSLGFKSLDIAMGAEIRYRSSYKADGYSPVLGQFYYQDSITISNPLPDISAYVHFRIRSFKAYVRAENLNTARGLGGFGFTNNNLVAPNYALPGLQIRIGVYWSFVN
jgi:Putative porin